LSLDVTFWGTRGSFPALGAQFARYGGDTSCVAAHAGARTLVLDAGSGFARMGKSYPGTADIDLFLSHVHLDHVLGLVYFDPIWRPGTNIRIWLEESAAAETRVALPRLFGPPFHPVSLPDVPATLTWRTYKTGEAFEPHPGVRVLALALPHPGGANGFRVDHGGASLVYGADTGALTGAMRADALRWAAGTDLLILDSTFTCAESEEHPDWGHMSWKEAVAFGAETGARRIALYHHGPDRTDDELDAIAREAKGMNDRTLVVRDGLSVTLTPANIGA
jgi:phosphoribosyl 1,2-cyclic phosphodiesterase